MHTCSIKNYLRVGRDVRQRFQCLGCGKCCSKLIIGPISSSEMARIVKLDENYMQYFRNYLRYAEKGIFLMSFKIITNKDGKAGGCAFFDERIKRCKIYKARPRICRMFPFRTTTLVWKECEWVRKNLKWNPVKTGGV